MLLAAFVATPASSSSAADSPIRLVRLPLPSSPLVTLRLVFQVGTSDEKPGKEGLAELTASMLGEGGTTRRTWSEVLDALYPMAAEIHFYGDKDAFVFSGTVHRDNLDAFAALLADQILAPRFSVEDFTRVKQDALDAITKTLRGNDDENLGKQALAYRTAERWNKLDEEYLQIARKHYRDCSYPRQNLWRKFHPEEAQQIRSLKN